jgi:PIN domain nuclease of toxin-antitoxin system
MNFLLDTHVFLWMVAEPEKLSVKAEEYIMNADNTLYLKLASASFAEDTRHQARSSITYCKCLITP